MHSLIGTGAPLVQMIIEKVALYVLVGVLMLRRINLLVDQIPRGAVPATLLLNA